MEQESSTSESGGESTLDRLESFLAAEDEQQEPSTPQPEAQQADAPATDEPAQVDAVEGEGETPNEYQLSDVAKLLGAEESALDVDEDGSVLIKTKVDGQEGKVKFSDLIKSYQLQGHVDKQVREAAELRKQAQEYAQSVHQQTQVQQAVVGKMAEAKAIETEYAQYQAVDLVALWDSDPVQAGKINQRMQVLQNAYQQKQAEINQATQHIETQQRQQSAASLQAERQALFKAVPEWENADVLNKEHAAIQADLAARGFSESDIKSFANARAVLLARDAMLYRQQKAAGSTTEKLVRQAPKIAKPGSTASRNTNVIQKLHNEVRKTGSKQSVVDYLLATGKV